MPFIFVLKMCLSVVEDTMPFGYRMQGYRDGAQLEMSLLVGVHSPKGCCWRKLITSFIDYERSNTNRPGKIRSRLQWWYDDFGDSQLLYDGI